MYIIGFAGGMRGISKLLQNCNLRDSRQQQRIRHSSRLVFTTTQAPPQTQAAREQRTTGNGSWFSIPHQCLYGRRHSEAFVGRGSSPNQFQKAATHFVCRQSVDAMPLGATFVSALLSHDLKIDTSRADVCCSLDRKKDDPAAAESFLPTASSERSACARFSRILCPPRWLRGDV